MKICHMGSHTLRESLHELLRELWVSYCSSRGMPFREWNFVFREWNFEFRELLRECPGTLRECPGTLRELREWPFHSESVFPEIGVVPSLPRKKRRILSHLWLSWFFRSGISVSSVSIFKARTALRWKSTKSCSVMKVGENFSSAIIKSPSPGTCHSPTAPYIQIKCTLRFCF